MTQDQKRGARCGSGFTLLELSISVALLAVVSLIGFIASSSSLKSADLTRRMTTLQEEMRSTMRALSDQVQPAVKRPRPGVLLPLRAQELRIVDENNPTAITFVVPTDMTFANFSGVNTIQFLSEDLPEPDIDGGEFGNGQLDDGEDTNDNGILDRQLVLIQPNGAQRALGGGNHLADVRFALSPDGSMLEVTMVATTRLEIGKERMLQYRLASNIYLMN